MKEKILERIKAELDLRYDIMNNNRPYNEDMLLGMIYAYEEMYKYIENLEE